MIYQFFKARKFDYRMLVLRSYAKIALIFNIIIISFDYLFKNAYYLIYLLLKLLPQSKLVETTLKITVSKKAKRQQQKWPKIINKIHQKYADSQKYYNQIVRCQTQRENPKCGKKKEC